MNVCGCSSTICGSLALTTIVVGYGLAVLTQIIVLPLFGWPASFIENFLLAAVFRRVPLVRIYLSRRVFSAISLLTG